MSHENKPHGEPRTYRRVMKPAGLVSFEITIEETDLHISAGRNLTTEARQAMLKCRETLEKYIANHQEFLTSLVPIMVESTAPQIVRTMARAGQAASVGPMAAVAGAVAEEVGRQLLFFSEEVIVENGGDIFLRTYEARKIAIYAGPSPFSMKTALNLPPAPQGMGVCTSAATTGHSLSFGKADAVVIVAQDTALADAWATAIGNMTKTKTDIEPALEHLSKAEGILGGVVIIGNALGAWGEVELCQI